MNYQKGLIQKNIRILKGKKWYHQRFDGCLHFLIFISDAEMQKEKRKPSGSQFSSHLVYFENDKADWYIEQNDIKRITRLLIEASLRNPRISRQLFAKWQKDERHFYQYCKKIGTIDIKLLSDQELKKLYQRFIDFYSKTITCSSIIDGFALGTDQLIQNKIAEFLKEKKLIKKQFKYFTYLTAPTNQSFINEAEIALLKLAMMVKRNKKAVDIIKKEKTPTKITEQLKKYNQIYTSLKKHQKEYFWSKNNYVDDNVLKIDDFIKEIRGLILSDINLKREINRIAQTPVKNKKEKNKILKKIKPPLIIRNLITISEDFTAWQDQRKKKTYWNTHYISLIIGEIGRRFGYTLPQMKYLTPPEVLSLFNYKKVINTQESSIRVKQCLLYQKGSNFEIWAGQKAVKAMKAVFREKKEETINDFRGLPASRGKVRGRVRIIKSAKECYKMQKGDILVAVMTRPDYIAGIKKAAAIVTDEGGVTCHAAIISRELGIPCVIGTKIATQVLKDGDIIDVNANHGVITIVKRK